MKKKIVSLALGAMMALSALTGCGESTYKAELPTASEQADIFVAPVEGLSEDFIKGMDISTVIAQEESGVKYYNEDGEEEDLFKILADSGINYIRVRVWNNPYDEDGNGYGGGNNDVEKAAKIGKRAAKYGMKLLVDFHYSDFWADPNKQYAPVEWKDKTVEEKQDLLYDFTVESLNTIIKAGADVGMVQIGNEINNGMAGENQTEDIMKLLQSASEAVRKVSKDIQIAVHYTEIDDFDHTLELAGNLKNAEVDYDIFGVSYYPFWHGTMENMANVLKAIKEQYGKDTCVMETSYAYTLEDGDCNGNTVVESNILPEYPASVQGQVNCIRDVIAAASDAGALGVFYWEGAWVPVGDELESNQALWEKYGSGWASGYAAVYDPKDAGQYYGACAWENQAMFDFNGKELASLDVFKYVNYGATCEPEVMAYKEVKVEIGIGGSLTMPENVEAIYNDPSINTPVAVTWDGAQVAAVDTKTAGDYTVEGTTADGTKVTAQIKVTNTNLLKNSSFEDADVSVWNVTSTGTNPTDIQNKTEDALSGENAFHFYSAADMEFSVEQTISDLAAGTYTAKANLQGGDVGDGAEIKLYAIADGVRYESDPVTLSGWQVWQTPVIKDIPTTGGDIVIGVSVKAGGNGWGTMDDFELFCQQ